MNNKVSDVMETKILTTTIEDLTIAADILKKRGNVIFPTETVYGIGADARNPEGVKNIFAAKGRPADNPLIVHISSFDMIEDLTEEIPEKARTLAEKYWPGPLTIILKKSESVPKETTAGLNTVALRMPENETARKLIEISGIPVAAPSANLSGKPSPTTAQHCIDDMMGRVDAIIKGDDCEFGVESTVVDLSGDKPILFRPGAVTLEQLTEVLGEVEVTFSVKEGEKPKSPGLKYKHYAPDAEIFILSGSVEEVQNLIDKEDKKVGMLVFDEFPEFKGVVSVSLGSRKKPLDAMHRLFSALREMDKQGVNIIYAPEIPDTDEWSAVKNRLYRAAGNQVINLSKTKKVLFVCTGNTCRSPMAEGIFNKICEDKGIDAKATSAGIFADGSGASYNTVSVMKELSVDIEGRCSRQISRDDINNADLVLTMTASHKDILKNFFGAKENIFTLSEFAGEMGEVSDPFGCDEETYRKCRDEIYKLVLKAVDKL